MAYNLDKPREALRQLRVMPVSPARSIALAYVSAALKNSALKPTSSTGENSSARLSARVGIKANIQNLQKIRSLAEMVARIVPGNVKNQSPELWYALEAALGISPAWGEEGG
jgi:hypothetical protein